MMHRTSFRLLSQLLQVNAHCTEAFLFNRSRPKELFKHLQSRCIHTAFYLRNNSPVCVKGDLALLDSSEAAIENINCFSVIPNFISSEEEEQLLVDIDRSLRGKKYQYDHWDGAIEGYRETEKSHWMEVNAPTIQRLKAVAQTAVPNKTLTALNEVHALDLAQDGHIKPHIDSVKFCGEVICGLSLLSLSVMKLQHEDNSLKWITALLPRLSLYIMRGVVRYKYTHAIPSNEESVFKGECIVKERRISIISRTLPPSE